MIEGIDDNLLKNGKIFDLYKAVDELCFNFEDFSKDNFKFFIESTFITDFIKLRKAYALRIYEGDEGVRFLAHKLKSPFSYLFAENILNSCQNLQNAIDNKNFDIKSLYEDLINEMNIFFKEFVEFSKKINMEIDSSLIEEYNKLNEECDINDKNLSHEPENGLKNFKGKNNINNNTNENINGHSKNSGEEIALGDVITEGKLKGNQCCGNNCFVF